MLTTKNYNFKKPELTDSPPDITVLNGNFDDIDEKIFELQEQKMPSTKGTISDVFTDIFVGNYLDEPTGHVTLTNGFTLQWVNLTVEFKGNQEADIPYTLPLDMRSCKVAWPNIHQNSVNTKYINAQTTIFTATTGVTRFYSAKALTGVYTFKVFAIGRI